MRTSSILTTTVFVVLFVLGARADEESARFKQWYHTRYKHALRNNCTSEYEIFLQGPPNGAKTDPHIRPLVACILKNIDELSKANMATSGILLGLLPSTLSLVGSSTLETSLLARRRPIFALLLVAAAPAVSPLRSTGSHDVGFLHRGRRSYKLPVFYGIWAAVVLVTQWLLALAALANVVVLSWQLAVRTVCTFATEKMYFVAMWVALAIPIHLVGWYVASLRYQVTFQDDKGNKVTWRSSALRLGPVRETARLQMGQETGRFLVLSWVLWVGMVMWVIFGTIVLSSLLFINMHNAIGVAARFLGSVLLCRVLLQYELMAMRCTVIQDDD